MRSDLLGFLGRVYAQVAGVETAAKMGGDVLIPRLVFYVRRDMLVAEDATGKLPALL